jgi:hypothetical protein
VRGEGAQVARPAARGCVGEERPPVDDEGRGLDLGQDLPATDPKQEVETVPPLRNLTADHPGAEPRHLTPGERAVEDVVREARDEADPAPAMADEEEGECGLAVPSLPARKAQLHPRMEKLGEAAGVARRGLHPDAVDRRLHEEPVRASEEGPAEERGKRDMGG